MAASFDLFNPFCGHFWLSDRLRAHCRRFFRRPGRYFGILGGVRLRPACRRPIACKDKRVRDGQFSGAVTPAQLDQFKPGMVRKIPAVINVAFILNLVRIRLPLPS